MTRNLTRPNPNTKPPANPAPPPKKERHVTFSFTVFETVEIDEDTIDLADGEIEVTFTGEIRPGLCINEMKAALAEEMGGKESKLLKGKLIDIFVCS
jgi:hypothetical protein